MAERGEPLPPGVCRVATKGKEERGGGRKEGGRKVFFHRNLYLQKEFPSLSLFLFLSVYLSLNPCPSQTHSSISEEKKILYNGDHGVFWPGSGRFRNSATRFQVAPGVVPVSPGRDPPRQPWLDEATSTNAHVHPPILRPSLWKNCNSG